MHGIVSLLPQPYYQQVEDLWDELERDFGLTGIRITPFPHFSWQIGESYDEPGLALTLETIAQQTRPFTVTTTGLGYFSGAQPVLYIPVVKSPQLVRFHQQVWKALEPVSSAVSEYYAPPNWMPHISLAYSDITVENIGAVTRALAFRTFNWSFAVHNFAYIYEPDGEIGTIRISAEFKTD